MTITSIDNTRLKPTLLQDGSKGVLLGTRCMASAASTPSAQPSCASNAPPPPWKKRSLSTHGALYSYTLVHVPPAGWPGPVPYILGQVELP